jgi:TonB family protein
MPDFLFGSFPNPNSNRNSWFERVRENLAQLFVPEGLSATSANGAPLHLLKTEKSPRARRAQSASLVIHAAIITAFVLLAMYPRIPERRYIAAETGLFQSLPFPAALLAARHGAHPSDGSGSGAGQTSIPATSGNLPAISSVQLVRPTLPDKQEHALPIPPTILDLATPPLLTAVDHMGLPWMKDDTRSPGTGLGHTLGDTGGKTVGDGGEGPAGIGDATNAIYAPGVTMPTCIYCPDPRYTDEAREAKLQGSVTLQVLVGADGRAAQIRVVRGLGMGLDDRAVQIVQGWRFAPARDGSRHAIASWVTVEAVYRLF